jgi:hypothetical protein
VGAEGGYRSGTEHKIQLDAPIERVQRELARLLKPGRSLVSAVRFADGKIEETVVIPDEPEKPEKKPKRAKPEAATTVAAPVRGCPVPEFARVEVRATRVLAAFLTSDQLLDFHRKNRFVAFGADTGHRYLVTSRHIRDDERGQLHDLDERRTYCVHDWDVPAPEEMLGLLVHLSLPGRERYLRDLPEEY